MDKNTDHDPKQTVPGLTSVYSNGRLHPKHLQVTGLFLLIASVAFWMISGNQSVLMVSSALSLIGVGSYTTRLDELKGIVARHPGEPEANGG